MSRNRHKKWIGSSDPVYLPMNAKLPDAWIFDMDGTLALLGGRNPYEPVTCDQDPVHHPVMRVQKLLSVHYNIIILSGREDLYRPQTERWLAKHGVHCAELHMRITGDNRNDAVIKAEIFRDQISPRFNVLGAFDDRDRVVKMWRWLGICCFQVQEGAF